MRFLINRSNICHVFRGVSNIAASFDSGLDVVDDEVNVNISPSASPLKNTSLEYEEVYRVGEVFQGLYYFQKQTNQ